MTEKKGTDTNSSAPIHLDSEQLEELDKLIKNLKKEKRASANQSFSGDCSF